MRWIILTEMLLLPAIALAESPIPMRSAAASITTSSSMNDVQACAIRNIAHTGRSVVVPIDRGIEIDELATTLLTKPVDPRFRLRVTDLGDSRKIEAFYRHPNTDRAVSMRVERMGRECGL